MTRCFCSEIQCLNIIRLSAHLQSDDPLVDVLPHAHLHVELRQQLVGIRARRSHVLTGRHVLREVQHVPLD